jgi:hypothetical protein
MSGLIDINPKLVIAGESRNSLKLEMHPCGRSKKLLKPGNASVQEKQETP